MFTTLPYQRTNESLDHAFTLIELLVVISIIVLLLSLLAPAMDKAITQAEMAMCGSNLDAISTGANIYCLDFKRMYPRRDGIARDIASRGAQATDLNSAQPYKLAYKDEWDDRPKLLNYIEINAMNCPLAGELDLSIEATDVHLKLVFASYDLWFGWNFDGNAGMKKLGGKWSYEKDRFNLIATDREVVLNSSEVHNSHPDKDGSMVNEVRQNVRNPDAVGQVIGEAYTKARWRGMNRRGLVDMNFATADGAVFREVDIKFEHEDERMTYVPEYFTGSGRDTNRTWVPVN